MEDNSIQNAAKEIANADFMILFTGGKNISIIIQYLIYQLIHLPSKKKIYKYSWIQCR
jgi:hypothetical protein